MFTHQNIRLQVVCSNIITDALQAHVLKKKKADLDVL